MTLNKILRGVIVGGLFLIPFIVLIVADWEIRGQSFGLYFPFISGKNFAFRIIVEMLFAVWLVLALRDPQYRPRRSAIFVSLAMFLAVIAAADAFGFYPYKSLWSNFERMEGLIGFLHFGAYFLVAAHVLNSEKIWSRLFHTFLGVSLFLCFYAILQISGELLIHQGSIRVDATLGNAIYLAVYLLFAAGLSIFFWVRERGRHSGNIFWSYLIGLSLFVLYYLDYISPKAVEAKVAGTTLLWIALVGIPLFIFLLSTLWKRSVALLNVLYTFLYAALPILAIVIIVYTGTRGVIIGIAAAILIWALITFLFARGKRKLRIVGAILIAVTLALAGLFLAVKDKPFVREHRALGRLSSLSLKSDDSRARLMVWNMAWKGFKDRPILGWGQENFNYVFNKYYDPRMYAREQWFDRTHNVFLDWLIAGGIVGLFFYLALFLSLIYVLWRRSDSLRDFTFAEKSIMTAILSGYFLQNVLVFDNLTSYIFFFTILAYVHSIKTARDDLKRVVVVEGTIINFVYVPLISALIVFTLWQANLKPILAGTTLIRALRFQQEGLSRNSELFSKALAYGSFSNPEIREQLAQVSNQVYEAPVDENVKNRFFEITLRELKSQLERTPRDARYQLFMGVFLNKFGRYEEALLYLQRTHELSPRKQTVLFELGTSYLNLGRFAEALEVFRKAYELAPSYDDARIIYVVGAIYAGKNELVEQLLLPRYGKTVIPDKRMAQAYFNSKQYGKSAEIWQEIIRENPTDPTLYLLYAGAVLQNGETVKAIKAIEKAVELNPSLKAQADEYLKAIKAGKR